MSRHTEAVAPDGTRLAVAVDGTGPPLLFLHEVAGDLLDWERQVEHFADRYTCVRYNARGYPPSDVPAEPSRYGQDIAVRDALAVLDSLGLAAAHVVGLSMGGFCALHLALEHPGRCLSVTVAGAGYGSALHQRAGFAEEARTAAGLFGADVPAAARAYQDGPTRRQFRRKDDAAWRRFGERLAARDAVGMSMTFAEVLARRPSLYDLRDRLSEVRTPALLVVGDEDDGCLDVNVMLKRTMPAAGLYVLPHTGHTVNHEEPDAFNELLDSFLDQVAAGRWPSRDPATLGRGLVGMVGAPPPARPRPQPMYSPTDPHHAHTRNGAAMTSPTDSPLPAPPTVRQLRLVVVAEDYEAAVAFYRDALGLPEQAAFSSGDGAQVVILDAGRATLEIANPAQKKMIDDVEVGRQVAPKLRVAFEVADSLATTDALVAGGAALVAPPTETPWRSLNA
ncbi:MAG TPA: alpha/beta fold hydrolase, partial [Nonomuraea sp.]|nr:alpha/beta fold hydrolase [Nonomuraea sp.]